MPVAGRKPKPDGQKRNRVKPVHDWTEVPDTPYEGQHPDPPEGVQLPAGAERWWSTLVRMPHCVLWADSDWTFALDTLLLAVAFHSGDLKVATELRQREKVLGTTADARRDLRIRYVDGDAAEVEGGKVASIAAYKAMLADGG